MKPSICHFTACYSRFGTATGFDLQLQDSGNLGHEGLLQARNMLLGMAAQNKQVSGVRPNGQEDSPQYKVNVNYDSAALWVSRRARD